MVAGEAVAAAAAARGRRPWERGPLDLDLKHTAPSKNRVLTSAPGCEIWRTSVNWDPSPQPIRSCLGNGRDDPRETVLPVFPFAHTRMNTGRGEQATF
mmetsp:Transcript_28713/g.39653  ORF Transcript_28713/g.39653 Transcript_28713/m.39653 type:complete len:98 (+) Transcript_28713:599-892(+)